jgi:N utilization substance protein A
MAVHTDIDNIDPVGACIGKNACRINNILSRIEPEKMDIIPWTNDPWEFVAGSLVPAGIVKIDPDHHEDHLSDVPKADPIGSGVAHVVVPKDHLHIALGENMVNLRLAEQLTGWKIRIRSED